MARKPRVLFLCTGNSCRSQMAEGWLRHLAGERVEALSAGTHPVGLNPLAVEVMQEAGVDIHAQTSDAIAAYLEDPPDLVVSVCSAAAANCPVFPGKTPLVAWNFEDPAGARGSDAEVLAIFRRVRDEIEERVGAWIEAGFPGLGADGLQGSAR